MPGARRWAVVAAAALMVVGLLAFTPGSARAGGELIRSDPAANAVLATVPARVTLEFSERVQPEVSHVAVFDAAGARVADADYEQAERVQVRMPVRNVADGNYTVAYHIIFADGKSITGAYRFSVGTGLVPGPLDAAALRSTTKAVAKHAHRIDGLSALLLVIDGVVLLGVLALLWLRPRNGQATSLRSSEQL